MKFNKWILGLCGAVAMLATTASAQLGFDTFTAVRSVVLTAPQILTGATVLATTNAPIDKTPFIGRGVVIGTMCNVTGTNSFTFQLFSSPDQTNWTAIANYALITGATAFSYTNRYYALTTSTNGTTYLLSTNQFLLPGTITTPNAQLAGFATPYMLELPFTNSGAYTVTNGTTGGYTFELGINLIDAGRYVEAVWTANGSATNAAVSATLVAPNIN